MEEKLQIVLKDYIREVEEVCNHLIKYINDIENLNLKNKFDFFEYRSKCRKMEFEAGEIKYRLHGKGCTAFQGKKIIDWDFGYRSRWCGIDPWKVSKTLKNNSNIHVDFYDANIIQTACEKFVEKGIMFKKFDQFYFELAEKETFKPEFPTEYDTLIIEYSNFNWSIPRSKVIDRFIRKSTRVYNQIDKYEDKYILKFLLDGRVAYTIPYNDISYPENAAKIMSDVIIRHLF